MPARVDLSPPFLAYLKKLARKYPSVLGEVEVLVAQLQNDQLLGDQIPNVGHTVYKVRLKNPAAQKGKSGGFRVIYYVRLGDHIILLFIYSKNDKDNIGVKVIRQAIKDLDLPDDEPPLE